MKKFKTEVVIDIRHEYFQVVSNSPHSLKSWDLKCFWRTSIVLSKHLKQDKAQSHVP